jgi:cytochrome P450
MLEGTLLLAAVVQRFRLELAPGETLRLVPSMTLRPGGGLRFVVRERMKTSA